MLLLILVILIVYYTRGILRGLEASHVLHNINIVDLNISKRSQDFFNIDINLKVNDLKHLDQLMLSLKLEETIYRIKRC